MRYRNKKVNLLEEKANEEKKISREISKLANSIRSDAVRSILQVIVLDTERHAKLYKSAANLLDPSRKMTKPSELAKIQNNLEYHIQEESKNLEEIRKLADEETNPKVKAILEVIIEDEIRHHKIFQTLKEAVMRYEVIEEQDIWENLWTREAWITKQI
ncbi:MAG: hypothetical protein QXJ17_07060 [Nitrososphaeria archaeon]